MQRPRHVILVNDFAAINGGQAKVAIDTARLLAGAGIGVTYFAACGPVGPELDAPGIEVVCLDHQDVRFDTNRLRAGAHGLWNAAVAKALRETCARFDPASTVLQCNSYTKALSPAIGPVVTGGPLPHVYMMMEYFLVCPNGGFYDYPRNALCTRRPLGLDCLTTNCDARHPVHKAWRVARQAVLWSAGRLPRGLRDAIYVSETQRRLMEPYLPPGIRLHHVPPPVHLPERPPVKAVENDAFLFVGRFDPEKGGREFAEAARRAGVPAVFVGDGPERAAIAAANPDAEFTGWLSTEEVQAWTARARCFVFPSLWYETFGLVAYDALAIGVPVICGRWNAAAEAVREGENGLLVDTPTVEGFTAALAALKDDAHPVFARIDPAKLPDISEAAYLERLLAVYAGILAQAEAAA
jgi:glycosyltransferase involved in cell wall biosynthesis